MKIAGVDPSISGAATSCVGFLQMMFVRAETVHEEAKDIVRVMNNHDSLEHFLGTAGFILPDNHVSYILIRFPVVNFLSLPSYNNFYLHKTCVAGWIHEPEWRFKDDAGQSCGHFGLRPSYFKD
jgi:hypothetical protein